MLGIVVRISAVVVQVRMVPGKHYLHVAKYSLVT
jgi:hypothetical protein